MFPRLVICALILPLLAGCSSSKWAIEDPVYAEKYDRPYEDGEKLPRMAKQIVDARHLANRSGTYVAGAYRDDPRSQAASIGTFGYGENAATSAYFGGNFSHTDFDGETLLGIETGTRIQAPSRLSPFVGAGATGGASADAIGRTVALFLGAIVLAILDDDDDDHDHSHGSNNSHTHDRDDGRDWRLHYSPFAAVYPELGVHYWVTHDTRLTLNARYMVTTEGRDHDFWLFGLSLGSLKHPDSEHKEVRFEPAESGESAEIAEILASRWESTPEEPDEEPDGERKSVVDQAVAEVVSESQPEQSPDEEQPQRSYWSKSWTDPKNTDAARHFFKTPQFGTRPK